MFGFNEILEKTGRRPSESRSKPTRIKETAGCLGLPYESRESTEQSEEINHQNQQFAKHFIREMAHIAYLTNKKKHAVDEMWPKLMEHIVSETAKEMRDLRTFGKMSLEKLQSALE